MANLFNFSIFNTILISAVPALICITIHELSHGFVAYKLGDNTAKDMGRLTLNPIKHIDILGLVMILTIGFGWAKPVPVNMNSFKNPKRHMAVTALAGPLSNIILAFIVTFIFMLLPFPYGGYQAFVLINPHLYIDEISKLPAETVMMLINLSEEMPVTVLMVNRLILINIFLAVFNMLPIPPLDGSKVLFSLLPERSYYKLMRYERFGMILLIVLIFSGRFIGFDLFNTLITGPAESLLVSMAGFVNGIVS